MARKEIWQTLTPTKFISDNYFDDIIQKYVVEKKKIGNLRLCEPQKYVDLLHITNFYPNVHCSEDYGI